MLVIALTFFYDHVFAQGSDLENYITPVTNITLVIGAFVGVFGGIRLYFKWNEGDCLFLVFSSLIVKAFSGL
jgi:hypothetical protein